jgi:hypothetical protein
MTSRDVSRTRLQDQLDVKIYWVLHASVAEASPPSHVWERITARLSLQVAMGRPGRWRRFSLACKGLVLWLLDSAVEPPAEFAYCYSPRLGYRRDKDYLCLLMYQYDLPMLLAQAM